MQVSIHELATLGRLRLSRPRFPCRADGNGRNEQCQNRTPLELESRETSVLAAGRRIYLSSLVIRGLTMPDTAFFCPELFDFLRQLKRHNNRDWFAKNKQRYEQVVRDPALLFIEQLRAASTQAQPAFRRRPAPHTRFALPHIS